MTEPQTTAAHRRPMDDEISLWEVLAVLIRRRGTIVLTTVAVTALALAFTLLRAEEFTTEAAFRPQGSEASSSQLMALASQFGVSVPGGGEEASPAFYAELLESREILRRAAVRPYDVEGEGTVLLKDLLEIEADTEALRDDEAIEWLRESAVEVSTGRETGTVTLRVTTEWPDLSKAIADELLAEVARFNLNTRQSQAAAERAFIQERVRQAEAELAAAEDSLRIFLESNRQWQDSPLLVFRQQALQREVTLRSSVLTTLVQSFEQARISEVRDTPVITVLQDPFLPPGPDDRRLLLSVALGIVLGGMMGIVLAFVVEAFRRPSEGDPAKQDFQETWDGLKRSIPFVGSRA
ncbi:MAG: Wzz/FepE/Etk N-terminal domain-containing protein [Longimicrobiales bacterium]|nr:Wzz/FepE/Etk N-terminal domain-containing protein [Longimicrobiales bacterium]